MNKAEWDAMTAEGRLNLVACKVMGWHWEAHDINRDGVLWGTRPKVYQEMNPQQHGPELEEIPHYTTNRNACALVLMEIKSKGNDIVRKMLAVLARENGLTGHLADEALWDGLCADPDTICYCAVKVVEDEPE